MKPISAIVNKSINQKEKLKPQENAELSEFEKIWMAEMNKHALMCGFNAPEYEIVSTKAKLYANELKYIPAACVGKCWEHARSQEKFVSVDKISNAWENVVKHNYYYDKQRKQSSMARIERSQPMSKVEHEKAMKMAWEAVESEGGFVPEWARDKYLTKEKK